MENEAYQNMLKKEAFEEAREEVRQEVREEVRQEVREEVAQEAREERNKEVARKMLNAGEPLKKIAEYTGLSFEEINRL